MSRRIVLKDTVTAHDIARLAVAHGWNPAARIEEHEELPYQEVWSTGDDDTTIHYVEDPILGVRYVATQGPGASEAESRIVEVFGAESYDDDEVRRLMRTAAGREESISAVALLGAVAPEEPDDELADLLGRYLGHSEPDVRRLAIFAAGYAGWPGLRAPLERIRDTDPDIGLRDAARRMLSNLEQTSWRKDAT